jgi:hypothetical protein
MKIDLAIVGRGAVTPAGMGLAALCGREPAPEKAASLRSPGNPWPVLRVNQKAPELLRWQREPRLRRSSPLTFFLIEAAAQALGDATLEQRARTGLIIAYSAGCLIYSRRFYEGILKEGPALASPALFPETVFNSPGSHVAATLQLNGAAYALVGDETALIAALKTAAIWLRRKRVDQVLVLGGDEFDPLALDAYRSARWLRPGPYYFLPSEGAGALLLRPARSGDEEVIAEVRDGYIYRNARQAASAAKKLYQGRDLEQPIYPSAFRNWLGPLEEKMNARRTVIGRGPYLGEAFTASAAWNLLRAGHLLSSEFPALTLPLWGLNHQLGVIELEARR